MVLLCSLDYEYQSKRKRDTPSYDAHCINSSTALGPPCPLYGVTQPTEAESKIYVHVHMYMYNVHVLINS